MIASGPTRLNGGRASLKNFFKKYERADSPEWRSSLAQKNSEEFF
jgi:hypothetical protein